MNSQSRAIVGFTLLGTLLVAIAWFGGLKTASGRRISAIAASGDVLSIMVMSAGLPTAMR